MRKKAFIFDLDGVIVFTDQYHYQAWKKVADRLGIFFDEKINNRLRGVSRMESLQIILENAGKEYLENEKQLLAEEKNEYYKKFLENIRPAEVTEEIRETLKSLREKGYKLAIGSSSKNARYILEKAALLDWFDAISDGTNISFSKPHPEVFLKAAGFLKESPEDCIVVEDACAGIDAAKAAGMTTVGIGDASGYEKADFKIQSFNQLLYIQHI